MSIVAHLEPLSKVVGNRRGAPRLVLYLGSMLGPCGSRAVIHDLSFTGLLFESSADLNTGDIIEVHLPQMGPTKTTVVRRDGTLFGCRFESAIPKAIVSAALLRSEPPRKVHQRAERGPRLDEQPSSSAGDHELTHRGLSPALRHLRALGIAALIVGGLTYILMTAEVVALGLITAAVVLLFALLVGWGFWVLDNTLEI